MSYRMKLTIAGKDRIWINERDLLQHLVARIERLEQVILAMAKGTESSPPEAGENHAHWVYPLNRAQGLIEEIGT